MPYKNYEDAKRHSREYAQRKGKAWRQDAWLRHKYGITHAEYLRMVEVQEGLCAICGLEPQGKGCAAVLNVDHDHDKGHVRGLLCNPCNQALGLVKDNVETLARMIAYVEKGKY